MRVWVWRAYFGVGGALTCSLRRSETREQILVLACEVVAHASRGQRAALVLEPLVPTFPERAADCARGLDDDEHCHPPPAAAPPRTPDACVPEQRCAASKPVGWVGRGPRTTAALMPLAAPMASASRGTPAPGPRNRGRRGWRPAPAGPASPGLYHRLQRPWLSRRWQPG